MDVVPRGWTRKPEQPPRALYSDNNQMQNLGPLKNSASGDHASGSSATTAEIWTEAGIRGPSGSHSKFEVNASSAGYLFAVTAIMRCLLPEKKRFNLE
jgi:hypothetical protein